MKLNIASLLLCAQRVTNCSRLLLATLFLAVLSIQAHAASIVWVSDTPNSNGLATAAWTTPAITGTNLDDGFIALLQAAGHSVQRFTSDDNTATQLTTGDLAALNTNDLIIIGRATSSGFTTGAQGVQWNTAITKPMIVQSCFLLRTNNFGWFTNPTAAIIINGTPGPLTATASNAKAAYLLNLFGPSVNGLTTVANYDEALLQNTSQTPDAVVPGGVVLATTSGTNKVIVEYPAGTPVRGGNLAGYRLYFAAGNREGGSAPSNTIFAAGAENLTPTGEAIFLRAVALAINNGTIPNAGAAPAITQDPVNTSVCVGLPLVLNSAASGENPLYFQWYLNDAPIAAGTNAIFTKTMQNADAGTYYVVVSNAVGGLTVVTSAVATVSISGTGTVVTPIANQTVCPGSSATFTANATGSGTLQYTWYKGVTEVQAQGGNNVYTINPVSAADAGTYSVVVVGDCNTVTNSFTLTVISTPTITTQPVSQTSPLSNGVPFVVAATATGATPTYQWQINGVNAVNGGNVAGATATTLVLTNLDMSWNGAQVRAIATTCAGSVTSVVATLTVQPYSSVTFDFNNAGQFGRNFAISILGHASPFTFWDTNGANSGVTNSRGLDFTGGAAGNDSTAVFTNAFYDFSRHGAVLNCSALVKIKAPTGNNPTLQIGFLNRPTTMTAERLTAFMSARIQSTAQPALTYVMRHQSKVSVGTTTIDGTASANLTLVAGNWYKLSVTFTNIKATTANSYTVTSVLQDMGTDGNTPGAIIVSQAPTTVANADIVNDNSLYLGIRGIDNTGADAYDNIQASMSSAPTYILAQPTDQTVLQGRGAAFYTYVDGVPPVSYQWFKDGNPISGATDWYLSIPNASASDVGFYSVQLNNGAIVSATAALTVTPDTDGPVAVSAGSFDGYTVGVRFSENVDPLTATTPGNYTVAGSSVYGVTMRSDGQSVTLALGTRLSGAFSVDVSGVKDLFNNTMSSATLNGNVQSQMTSMDIGGPVPLGTVYTAKDGDFEITGGGADIWGTADQGRFTFQSITGDFDVKVLVTNEVPALLNSGGAIVKAGLGARETADAGSINVDNYVMPQFPGLNRYETGLRAVTGGTTAGYGVDPAGDPVANGNIASYNPTSWLRLRRVGNAFASYASSNGVNWRLFAITTTPTVETLLVGPIFTSHAQNFNASATFANYGAFAGYPGAVLSFATNIPYASTNIQAGQTVAWTVLASVSGAPSTEIVYKWQRSNGAGGWTNLPNSYLTGTSNTHVYTTMQLFASDNGAQFRALASVTGAGSITSSVVTVTVADTAAPTISAFSGAINSDLNHLMVTFNEPMGASATVAGNYTVTNAAGTAFTVASAAFLNGDPRTVILTMAAPLPAGTYGVRFSTSILDANGVPVAANTVQTFRTYNGVHPVVGEIYQDINAGGDIVSFTNHHMYLAGTPTYYAFSNLFGYNADFVDRQNQVGVKFYANFIPPTNGNYKFWFRHDDNFQFWMNTNGANPAGKALIATNTGSSSSYIVGQSFNTNITLVAGQEYYMEILVKENTGGEGFSVMWTHFTNGVAPASTVFIPFSALSYPTSAPPMKAFVEIYAGPGGSDSNSLFLATNTGAFIARAPSLTTMQKGFSFMPGGTVPSGVYNGLTNSRTDNYVGRIVTLLTPPTSGSYRFWIRSDDASQLWMTTNGPNTADGAGMRLLGGLNANNATYQSIATNVNLVGGQTYYLEGRWKEGGGGDGIQVAIRSTTDTAVPPNSEQIPTSWLSMPPTNSALRFGEVTIGGITPVTTNILKGQSITITPINIGGSTRGLNYLYYRNGTLVSVGVPQYTTPPLDVSDSGTVFTLVVTNEFSVAQLTSTVTVANDVTVPTVLSAVPARTGDSVLLTFSEALESGPVSVLANFQIPGLTVLGSSLDSTKTKVTLTTAQQVSGATYTITLNGLRDLGGNLIPANSQISFTSWAIGGIGLYGEMFTNITSGSAVANLTADAKYINNAPDDVGYVGSAAFGSNPQLNNFTRYTQGGNGAENYGFRLSGYFVPPTNGFYRFFIRSDDASQLFMNTNGMAAGGRTLMAREDSCCHNYDAGTGTPVAGSTIASISPWVFLTNGGRYYTELLMKEGTGGDFVQMAVRTGATPSSLDTSIPGTGESAAGFLFTTFGDPTTTSISVTETPPQDIFTVENHEVDLLVIASVPAKIRSVTTYQWQKWNPNTASFTNIPGAAGLELIFRARLSDDGAQYRMAISGPGASTNINVTLHVSPDTTVAELVSAGSLDGSTFVVRYDEPMEIESVNPLYYTLNGGGFETIATNSGYGIRLLDDRTVIFQLTPASAISGDTVAVDVCCLSNQVNGMVISFASAIGTVARLTPAEIGTPGTGAGNYNSLFVGFPGLTEGSSPTETAPAYYPISAIGVASNGVDVTANGWDIWGAADGFHFDYRQIAGNFDIKTRVEKFVGADQWSKAGLMARATLTNSSRNVFFGLTPRSTPILGQVPINNYTMQWRDSDGATSANLTTTNNPPTYPNAWVRLKRTGSVFTGYMSSNGVDWVVYTTHDSGPSFPNVAYVGLATAGHDQTRGMANNALAQYRDIYYPLAPSITTPPQPASTNLAIHQEVTFSGVTAVGIGPFTYQWQKDGVSVANATNATLTLTNLRTADAGAYSVIIANDGGGSVSATALLTVSNSLPVVANENIAVNAGTGTNIAVGDLLVNDVDPEGDPLSITTVSARIPRFLYSADFNGLVVPNANIYGSAALDTNAIGTNGTGSLRITAGAGSLSGSLVINELTPGVVVSNFTATFYLRISDGSAEPADGFSFNFANDLTNAATGITVAEDGLGTGLSFCIDNYRFAPFPGGGTANTSGMKIRYGGLNIAAVQMPTWNTPRLVPVSITLAPGGIVTVLVDGTNVFGNVTLTNFVPTVGRFGIYARTGGSFQAHYIDDLTISDIVSVTPIGARLTYTNGVVTYSASNVTTCGNDTVYYVVSDGQLGGTSIGEIHVTVRPTNGVLPLITQCATNRAVTLDGNCQFTLPDLRGEVTATGNCLGGVNQTPAAGTVYSAGASVQVTLSVTDIDGNMDACQVTITGADRTAPSVTCPSDITAEATSPAGAVVTFSAGATDACDANPTVVYSPASGSTFPLGTNTVTVTTYDVALNTNTCTFKVIVRDTTSPVANCPSDIIVVCTNLAGMAVNYTPGATDAADPSPSVLVTPASGTVFSLGTNTVQVTATDASGNQGLCSFKVIVVEPTLLLGVTRSETNVVITWPQSCVIYQLQESADISSPANWAPCSATIESVGNSYRAVIPAVQAQRFYQLKKP